MIRLEALQYLRAAAAIAVVYSHAAIQVDEYQLHLPETGSFGVDVFFVISGFIMVFITRDDARPLSFMANRIRRVVPLYWFFTGLMAAILLLLPAVFRSTLFSWESLAMSLGFWPYFSPNHSGMVWPLLAPGWSLNYEMYFYAIFALCLLLPATVRVWAISAIIAAVLLVSNLIDSTHAAGVFLADSVVLEFVMGMWLAVAWKRGWRLPSSRAWLALVWGVIAMFGASLLLQSHPELPRALSYGFPALLIVIGCVYLPRRTSALGLLLGDASYALYLSHIFTLGVLRKLLPPMLGEGPLAAWLFALIATLICIVVSVPIHQWIDNWLLRRERLDKFRRPEHRAGRTQAAVGSAPSTASMSPPRP